MRKKVGVRSNRKRERERERDRSWDIFLVPIGPCHFFVFFHPPSPSSPLKNY
jgi:hypothetical protein